MGEAQTTINDNFTIKRSDIFPLDSKKKTFPIIVLLRI